MTTEKGISDKLFDKITSAEFSRSVKDSSKAKRQRLNLISQIRIAVELKDGKSLWSSSDEAAFSKHGSLYQRLTSKAIKHDIDIYVGLNGKADSLFCGQMLLGPEGQNPNFTGSHNFPQPSDSRTIVKWMSERVQQALASCGTGGRVSQSKRGAVIKEYGSPKRDYDIIPAFVFTDDKGKQCHLIPSGDGKWEINRTQRTWKKSKSTRRCILVIKHQKFSAMLTLSVALNFCPGRETGRRHTESPVSR
jgi:hypothetical protein